MHAGGILYARGVISGRTSPAEQPGPMRPRVRAPNSILRSCRFCLTPAPALTGSSTINRPAFALDVPKAWRLRAFACSSRAFSSDPRDPLRADAAKLSALTTKDLGDGLQVSAHNPITGLDGRAALLARLGHTLLDRADVFALHDSARPGGLFDHLATLLGPSVAAPAALREVLVTLGPIWPSRLSLGGVALGDTWKHSAIRRSDPTDGLVPLHKLSQWLMYSLIEPMTRAGVAVTDLDGLTGLAEYRNGGLFIDTGVLTARDPSLLSEPLAVDCEAVVEWRALTVALLDRLARLVQHRIGGRAAMPLASILEGGTWAAGRRIAQQKRADGRPPLNIASDGSVF
jgi:Protein of unknown function (DUF1688).